MEKDRISLVRTPLSGVANNGSRDTDGTSRFFPSNARFNNARSETSPTTHTNYASCRMHHYGTQCSVHQVHSPHRRNILLHPFARPHREGESKREREREKKERKRERGVQKGREKVENGGTGGEREEASHYHRPGRRPRP